jgi:50S ribosomal protein L16 3-hydroxylase
MSHLVVANSFDWTTFVELYWDKQPVLFKGVHPAPFVESEVFAAAVSAQRTADEMTIPPKTQLTIERLQQTAPRGHLPADTDGSFDGYERRMTEQLAGLRYALVVNVFHAYHYPLWTREREFFADLWERVGLPLSGAITTLFHGTYEHSPVGVHKDRFATFMFGLRGLKRMRFWSRRPWQQQVTTILDYQEHIPSSFAAEVEPGDLLYWPSSYYHVGESAGTEPATSVNTGIPREEHTVAYELEELLVDLDPAMLVDAGSTAARLPAVTAPLLSPGASADGLLPPTLPPALDQAARIFRETARELHGRLTRVSLQRWTAGGFQPVPPSAPIRPLSNDTVVRGDDRFPVEFTDDMCAANGHAVSTDLPPPTVRSVLERLRSGQTVRVGDVPPEIRRLLEQLESFRGITRV